MRVLFVPRPDADRIFGGDVVQMRSTSDALRALGVAVDIGDPQLALSQPYDIVHLWTSLHFPHVLAPQLDALEPVRGRSTIALSTIWAPHHTVHWMDAARKWLFSTHPNASALTIESARAPLTQIAERALTFTIDGRTLPPYDAHPMAPQCRAVLRRIDLAIPNSWMELQAIFSYLGDHCAHAVAPNAVNASFFDGADPAAIPPELRGRDFAMMSARFDSRKQQDFAILALKELDIPLVFVGEQTDGNIFERFRAIGSNRRAPVFYYPFVPQGSLRHLYAAARVHFLPSIFESPGLATLEAALLDCSVVAGNLAFESEYFREDAHYCDPCDAFSIAHAVQRAWSSHETTRDRRTAFAARIRRDFTWDAAARATVAGYEKALARR
jgi:glycosyltransferase involved in cell wall biosynthesis